MATTLEHIREGEAPAELAGLYRDIRHCLRIPYVPLPLQILAAHRGALRAVWQQLRPDVVTRAFEESASDLRATLARAAVELGTRLIEPVLASAGVDVEDLDELREQIDVVHYADPKVLLILTALREMSDGSVLGGRHLRAALLEKIPTEHEADIPPLVSIREEPGGVAGEVVHTITHALGLPFAPADLRALGHWPEILEIAWDELSPLFQHHGLPGVFTSLHQEAAQLVQLFPFAIDPSKGLLAQSPEALAALTRVVGALSAPSFRLALFVSALKVALDGPEDAIDSQYALEWEEPPVDQIELR